MWGTSVLSNEAGTWEGTWVGLMMPDTSEEFTEVFAGTRAYEGLRYHLTAWHPSFGAPWTLTGWIEPVR